MVKSFTIFEEYYDLITLLSEEEQGHVLLAITRYMFEDKETELNERETKVFVNLKRPLDVSKKNSKRSKGNGAPVGNKNAKKTNQNQTENKPKTNQKTNVKTNTSKMSMSMSMSNVNNKKFIKPTLDEVKEYCVERKNNINPESFISYYESNGWKVGKNPMKDWKACIRSWEAKDYNRKPQEQLPEWFGKEIKKEEISDERKAKAEAIRNGTYKP